MKEANYSEDMRFSCGKRTRRTDAHHHAEHARIQDFFSQSGYPDVQRLETDKHQPGCQFGRGMEEESLVDNRRRVAEETAR